MRALGFCSLILSSMQVTVGSYNLICIHVVAQSNKLTVTNCSNIFRVVTVALEYLIVRALQEVVLTASTHHIVQSDWTRTGAKVTVNTTYWRAWMIKRLTHL